MPRLVADRVFQTGE